MAETHEVYECWVSVDKDSFVKFDSVPQVMEWIKKVLREYDTGTHINIGIHSSDEYK